MNTWNDLSIREKAEMMRVAISNGVTNINDIKKEYNEFAQGGNLYVTGGPTKEEIERLFWEGRMEEAEAALAQVPKRAPTPIIDKQLPELTVYPQRDYPDPYSIPQGEITPVTGNALSRAINNYTGELKYDLANGRVPGGKYTLPAAVLGATGAAGLAKAGEMAYAAGATPLIMEGMNVPFIASGLNNLYHGNADWQTALEIAPLGHYVMPIAKRIFPRLAPKIVDKYAAIKEAYNRNPEISKVGSIDDYNDYLKTVFPESKIQDIQYHMGPKGIEELKGSTGEIWNTNPKAKGIYVSPTKEYPELIRKHTTDRIEKPSALKYLWRNLTGSWDKANAKYTEMYPVLINTKNPLYTSGDWTWGMSQNKYDEVFSNYDGIVNSGTKWYQRAYKMPETIVPSSDQTLILGSNRDLQGFKQFMSNKTRTPQITAENAAKVNWDADNWFKKISGRTKYSDEEVAELASHVPEYRKIEKRLFNEGKLIENSDGTIAVKDSKMSPQEYIMRQSEAFQKMNPDHHYVGVNKYLRDSFENKPRDSNNKMYEIWTNRKNPKDVEEYALTPGGGNPKSKDAEIGGKVFDVTFPKDAVQTPIIDAEGAHWTDISFDNILRDAPDILSHYNTVRPSGNSLPTDAIVKAAKRHGYGVTNIDNVMDTYNGKLLDETIIGKDTPAKSVLGNTGTFSLEGPNKWKLYRSLSIPLTIGTAGILYNQKAYGGSLLDDGGILGGVTKGMKVNTDQCATWSNGLLRNNGYLISGNAWNLNDVDTLYNGFTGLERPGTYDRKAVENYNHLAADNVYKNFDSKTLDKTKPYVVNMFYNNSPALEDAYNNGKNVTGTHTGILTYDNDKQKWIVTHNIHGKIHQENFVPLQSGKGKYGVTAVYQPREDNIINRVRGFFGFADGGNLFDWGGPIYNGGTLPEITVSPNYKKQSFLNRPEVTNLSFTNEIAAQSPLLYTTVKALDPTGITGWSEADDAFQQASVNPSLQNIYNAAIEIFGSIPIIGKYGKAVKNIHKAVLSQEALNDYKYAKEKEKEYNNELVVDYWDNVVKTRKEAEKHAAKLEENMSYRDINHLPAFKLAPSNSKYGDSISDYHIKSDIVDYYKQKGWH